MLIAVIDAVELHVLDCKTSVPYPASSIGHSTVDRMQLLTEGFGLHCVLVYVYLP